MQTLKITKVVKESQAVVSRFPIPVIISLAATYISILWINIGYREQDKIVYFTKILSVLLTGFPLMLSIALLAEKRKIKTTYSLFLQSLAGGLLLLLYFSLPAHLYNIFYLKITLLGIAFSLLISFIAFSGKEQNYAFWHFNIRIFLRIITGFLYTGVLFAGLALALTATGNLFDLHIPGKYYSYLSIIIMGLLYSLFILSGIPALNDELKQDFHYPKVLKIFVQYILIPIVLVYLVILYAYGTKILILWSLPKGWVAYLISSFAILGIFSFLLIYPVHRQNPFLHRYYQFFFPLLLPLLLLLFAGIYVRIEDYGITTNRYLLTVLFLWLSGISIYLIFNKLKNIIFIPASIFVMLLLIYSGPWGISAISQRSQMQRLTGILEKNGRIQNGKYVQSAAKISFDDKKQISSIISYLCKDFGYRSLQPLFTENPDSLIDENEVSPDHFIVQRLMKIAYVSPYATEMEDAGYLSFKTDNPYYRSHLLPITSYDYYLAFQTEASGGENKKTGKIALNDTLMLTYHTDFHSNTIHFRLNDKPLFDWELNPLINSITNYQTNRYEDYSLTETQSQKTFSSPDMDMLIIIEHIEGEVNKSNETPEITLYSINANIFLRHKATE